MNKKVLAVVVMFLSLLVIWLQREAGRGAFREIERGFLSWLAANTIANTQLPPLTVVLYDEEASEVAGSERMAMLDGALFARASARLGAVAAVVEGLQGDPARMIQAADGMPVFGGYTAENAPGQGWTSVQGEVQTRWMELPGVAGRGGRYLRGFIALPSQDNGLARVAVVARCADRAVPSLLAVVWSTLRGWRSSQLSVDNGMLTGPGDKLLFNAEGEAMFLPGTESPVMSLNELLVETEKFEREGGTSPLRGRVLLLARATSDVARVTRDGTQAVTPMELWASAWEELRMGRFFLPVGWWYHALLIAVAVALAYSPARFGLRKMLLALVMTTVVFLLFALASYAAGRVLLPAVPTMLSMAAGLAVGRIGFLTGWLPGQKTS